MKRNWRLWLLGLALMLPLGSAMALDPSSTQAYCNAVKQAALDAQKNYVKTYTPQQDPQQVFDDSTLSCMSNIASFSVPSMDPWIAAMDQVLQKMAQQLLLKACDAARQKFQEVVNNAQQSVNGSTQGMQDLGLESGLGGMGRSTIGIGVNGSGVNVQSNGGNPIGRIVNDPTVTH